MKDKIVVVTGANTGLGKQTALKLAQFGAHVILACRSIERGQAALDEIKNAVPESSLELLQLDLSDWDSVKHFSEELHTKYKYIDVLINNAGVVKAVYAASKHGQEEMLTVNYYGTALLSQLLLDLLERSPDNHGRPRLVSVTSGSPKFAGPLYMDQLKFKEDKNGVELYMTDTMSMYGRSKLCALLFLLKLNKLLRESNSRVLVFSADPGWVRTELNRAGNDKFYIGLVKAFESMVAKTPEEGVIPCLYAACNPSIGELEYSGKSFSGIDKEADLEDYSKDEKVADALWEWTQSILAPYTQKDENIL